jgi:hypothetical protein
MSKPASAGFSTPKASGMPRPKVQISAMLRASLEADGFDVQDFCNLFAEWKTDWPEREYTYWFFGKDGEYVEPKRNGRRVLRHVHLPPELDPDEEKAWTANFERRMRKASDTALVYAYDPAHGYLLIYVAREPKGHELSDMDTPETKKLMNIFADQAEAFIFSGSVFL